MAIDLRHLGMVALGVSLIAGCTTSTKVHLGTDDDNWGEANRQTMMAQVVDPAPQYDYAVPEGSGDHTAKALERYRTGVIKQPDRIRTSNSVLGSGSSSSSN